MEIDVARTIWRHTTRKGNLCKTASNAELLGIDDRTVRVGVAGAQHHSIMRIYWPIALGLYAHVPSSSMSIQEEAVIGHYDRFLEAHAAKLMQRHANEL